MTNVEQPEEQTIERWVNAAVSTRVARLLSYRAVAEREANPDGRVPPLYSSVARAANTLNDQFTTSTLFELLVPDSFFSLDEPETAGGLVPLGGELEHEWRQALGATVAAGTLEVQLMVIAREVLGRSHRES
jgi:alkylation response protein AidB-like acyl-CoA dehydrogenase